MKNPYLRSLAYVTVICGLIALALYCVAWILVGRAGDDPGKTGFAQIVAANEWLTFTGFTLVATLVLGGIVWRSPAAKAREDRLNRSPRHEPIYGEDD